MAALDGRRQWAVNRRVRAALLVNGLRWRGRSSLAMFAVAVFACGAAAFGPIYLRSGDQLALNRTLGGAVPANAGLTIENGSFPISGHHSRAWLERFARNAPEPSSGHRWWGSPIMTERAGFRTVPILPQRPGGVTSGSVTPGSALPGSANQGGRSAETVALRRPAGVAGTAEAGANASPPAHLVRIPFSGTKPYDGSIVARTGVCAHLDIVQGRCPAGEGVVVSTRTAQTLGLVVGGALAVDFSPTTPEVRMPIVGIYHPGNPFASYWWEENYFGFDAVGPTDLLMIDSVFTTPQGVRALAPHRKIYVTANVPYRQGSLTLSDVGLIQHDLVSLESHALHDDRVRVSTRMLTLLGQAGSVEHTEATVVDVVDLELVLLGILVLYFVASRTAAEREPDVRLGELRGFRSRSTIAVALAEPVAVVGAAVPVGLLGAWLVAGAVTPAIFGPRIGSTADLLAVGAAVAAGIVGVAAAGLGARRSLVGGLSAAADAAPGEIGRSRWQLLGDAVVVAVAGAAFFALAVGGDSGADRSGSNPLAALAPGLLALALGMVAARLLPRILNVVNRRNAFSSRLAASLATRTVGRRREYRSQLVLTALAVALAVFAVSGWAIAAFNRNQKAEVGVGATRVLSVAVRQGTTFLKDVQAANPNGREAMPVVVEHAANGTTLAVDARRLGSTAIWPTDLGLRTATAARRLHPTGLAPEIRVAGRRVAFTIDSTGHVTPPPQLSLEVYDVDTQFTTTLPLGSLTPGLHRYTAGLYSYCPGGCRLVGLSVTWSPPKVPAGTRSPAVTMTIRALRQQARSGGWRTLSAGLGNSQDWFLPLGGAQLSGSSSGLEARFSLIDGTGLVLAPKDVPSAVPVIVTPTSSSTASGDGGPLVVGLDGSTLPGHTVGEVAALPGVHGDAVLATLQAIERYQSGRFVAETSEVWLAKSAPASIVGALRAHGLRVLSQRTAASAVQRLDHNGLTVAYLLYLVAAVAAALLVIGATAFTLSSAARRRQEELAALRAVGVNHATLRHAVQIEQALVLLTGIVVGAVAGAVAAVVALRSVPEFVVRTPGPPLQLGLPALDLATTVVAVVLALGATVLVGSAVVARGAAVERLAGGQP